MRRKAQQWKVMLLFFVICCGGCERRDLYYKPFVVDYAEIEISLNWNASGLRPDDATVLFYREGDSVPMEHIMLADYEVVKLKEGRYSIVVFNQKIGDFDGIDFRNINDYHTIQAYAKPLSERMYTRKEASQLIENPDLLAVASRNEFIVTNGMVEETRTRVGGTRGAVNRAPVGTLTFTPKLCVSHSKVIVHIKGMYNILNREARGSLDGFAESIYLHSQQTTHISGIQQFMFTKMEYYEGSARDGQAEGSLNIFGLCTPQSAEEKQEVVISFEAILWNKDETHFLYSRNVDKLIDSSTPAVGMELVIELGLDAAGDNPPVVIPDVEPKNGGSFEPGIPDWGKEEVVEK